MGSLCNKCGAGKVDDDYELCPKCHAEYHACPSCLEKDAVINELADMLKTEMRIHSGYTGGADKLIKCAEYAVDEHRRAGKKGE